MRLKFKKEPLCEICHAEPATCFEPIGRPEKHDWKFVGVCRDSDFYYIPISNFFKTPSATTDCLAHMHEKNWMNWRSFMDMMHRFRAATESFNNTNA